MMSARNNVRVNISSTESFGGLQQRQGDQLQQDFNSNQMGLQSKAWDNLSSSIHSFQSKQGAQSAAALSADKSEYIPMVNMNSHQIQLGGIWTRFQWAIFRWAMMIIGAMEKILNVEMLENA